MLPLINFCRLGSCYSVLYIYICYICYWFCSLTYAVTLSGCTLIPSNLFLQTWFVLLILQFNIFNILILQSNICSHFIWLHAHFKPSIHCLTSGKRFIFRTFAEALIIETCSCLTFQMFHSKCHIFLNRFWGPLSPSLSLFLDLQMKLSLDGAGMVDLL